MIELRESAGGVSFAVRAQPGARRTEIAGEWQGRLRTRLAAPASEGLANETLRWWLAERLKVPVAAIRIAQGQRSRSKLVEVAGITAAQVYAALFSSDATATKN
jgi:uncharacterized protein (TIGR00251 family)